MNEVQKSILKILVFFDLFDYPLLPDEILMYLNELDDFTKSDAVERQEIKKYRAAFQQVQGGAGNKEIKDKINVLLNDLISQSKIETKEGFYFLFGRQEIIQTRKERYEISLKKIKRAQRMVRFLSGLPFIKMIALGNMMGYLNLKKKSDIDLFIITTANRIWQARWWSVGMAKILRLRPLPHKVEDKFCFTFFITEDHLNLQDIALDNDIYFYYWLTQLVPLYDEQDYFDKFVEANQWVSEHLSTQALKHINTDYKVKPLWPQIKTLWEKTTFNIDEKFVKWWQIRWMPKQLRKLSKEKTGVIVSDDLLKFHLEDKRTELRDKWQKKIQDL